MTTDNNIDQKVIKVIAAQLEIKEDEVNLKSSIMNDLGADSLDVVELIMALEDEYKIEIPDSEAEKLTTVEEIISYIAKHLK